MLCSEILVNKGLNRKVSLHRYFTTYRMEVVGARFHGTHIILEGMLFPSICLEP